MKLDIGAGKAGPLPGYESWDIAQGRQAYPLALPDGSVEAIHASHVLEHFGRAETGKALADWVRALAPGGWLQVAVPDFDKAVALYHAKRELPIEGYIVGGQTDATDYHKALFTEGKLRQLMTAVGLVDIRPWKSTQQDCAALEVSLNLEGRKPETTAALATPEIDNKTKVVAVWSTPRLGFFHTFDAAYQSLPELGLSLIRGDGVFWGQALEGAMLQAIEKHGAKWLLALDYDSIWKTEDIRRLVALVNAAPGKIDALCPHEWNRQRPVPLWTPVRKADGTLPPVTLQDVQGSDLFEIGTGHFGCTFLRVEALLRMPHPWFLPTPNAEGRWTDGKIDDDFYFWRKFRECGGRAFLATKVVLGHLEDIAVWPSETLTPMYQTMIDYRRVGKPAGAFGVPVPETPTTPKDSPP